MIVQVSNDSAESRVDFDGEREHQRVVLFRVEFEDFPCMNKGKKRPGVRPVVDNLRLYLTSFDPRLPISSAQQENLQNLVKSQAGRTNIMELFTKLEATELRKAKRTKVVFAE